MMAMYKTLMKTSVKDKASYFDEIIFLLYTFSTIKTLRKYIYTQSFCSERWQNNQVNECKALSIHFFIRLMLYSN
jgi:hypothetical protein